MGNSNNSTWLNVGLVLAGLWALNKIFKVHEPASISGLPNAKRKLDPYINSKGENPIIEDIRQFHFSEHSQIIRMFQDARLAPSLTMPFYKPLRGTKITGELKRGQWRVLIYKVSDTQYLILSVFKKKTDNTPKGEIEKAEKRLNEYLQNRVAGLYSVR